MIRLCAVDDVPAGEGRLVRVDGCSLAVYRTAAGWFASQADCPHLGGPLADGIAADRSVICPLHERRFDLETGSPLGHECMALRTYPVREQGGEVFLVGGDSPIRAGGAELGAEALPFADVAKRC